MGEEEPALGPPLSVPLLLKYDISEAAGAPKRSGEEMATSGESEQRGTGDWRGVRKEIKKAPGVCLLPTEA